jgi:hypothetical protein
MFVGASAPSPSPGLFYAVEGNRLAVAVSRERSQRMEYRAFRIPSVFRQSLQAAWPKFARTLVYAQSLPRDLLAVLLGGIKLV